MIETYSPLTVADYFEQRLKDFYQIPPGISIQLWDASYGIADKLQEWHVAVANVSHETEWTPPWGHIKSRDFFLIFRKIAFELETKFGVAFPR